MEDKLDRMKNLISCRIIENFIESDLFRLNSSKINTEQMVQYTTVACEICEIIVKTLKDGVSFEEMKNMLKTYERDFVKEMAKGILDFFEEEWEKE